MSFRQLDKLIKRGDIVSLRHELDAGLDPNLANRYGYTILMSAAIYGGTHIGRLLIERGAQLDCRSTHRETALSLAIQSGHPSFVKLLLEHGASVDCNPHGNTLDIFLDWCEKYTSGGQHIRTIRALFDEARSKRMTE